MTVRLSTGARASRESPAPRPTRIEYGDHPEQVLDLYLPESPDGATALLLHGGSWRAEVDRSGMEPLARDLAARGVVAVNAEYRRTEHEGGGWPGTFEDVAAAIDALADIEQVDADRVVAIGHSAGGALALWAAARPGLPGGAPGSGPRVAVRHVISMAGIADLRERSRADGGRVAALLGGAPGERGGRCELASPIERLPLAAPVTIVHGEADETVSVQGSHAFMAAVGTAGGSASLIEVPDGDHFSILDPADAAWAAALGQAFGPEGGAA